MQISKARNYKEKILKDQLKHQVNLTEVKLKMKTIKKANSDNIENVFEARGLSEMDAKIVVNLLRRIDRKGTGLKYC